MLSLEETTALVRTVFRTVWSNFYRNEQLYSQQSINALARSQRPLSSTGTLPPHFHQLDAHPQISGEKLECFTVYGPDSDQQPSQLPVEYVVASEFPFSPHPPYESCTPCSQSIFLGDDPEEMPFIPFADDPHFDHVAHTLHYDHFAWQPDKKRDTHSCDPDCKSPSLPVFVLTHYRRVNQVQLIVMETVHCLHTVHGVSLAHIDETEVLPISILSTLSQRGQLARSRQRQAKSDLVFPIADSQQRLSQLTRRLPITIPLVTPIPSTTRFCRHPWPPG